MEPHNFLCTRCIVLSLADSNIQKTRLKDWLFFTNTNLDLYKSHKFNTQYGEVKPIIDTAMLMVSRYSIMFLKKCYWQQLVTNNNAPQIYIIYYLYLEGIANNQCQIICAVICKRLISHLNNSKMKVALYSDSTHYCSKKLF